MVKCGQNTGVHYSIWEPSHHILGLCIQVLPITAECIWDTNFLSEEEYSVSLSPNHSPHRRAYTPARHHPKHTENLTWHLRLIRHLASVMGVFTAWKSCLITVLQQFSWHFELSRGLSEGEGRWKKSIIVLLMNLLAIILVLYIWGRQHIDNSLCF